jgi:soluble lytic murein transglycosylase-like protein
MLIRKGFISIFCFLFLIHLTWGSSTSGRQYDHIIRRIAQKYDVDPELVHSIIRAESNYDSQAVSPKGAVGLMQLMPETAKELGIEDPYDPTQNIEGGVKLLKNLRAEYGQKHDLVLAAYNAGQDAVEKHNGIPPYPETITYIKRVKSYWKPEKTRYGRTKIYSFRDKNGKLVITNDHNYFLMNKKQGDNYQR